MLESTGQEDRAMTLEELEFKEQHPKMPESLIPGFLAELKRGRALKEGAKRAADRGMSTRALPIPVRRADTR
jgi:hypothetical protein